MTLMKSGWLWRQTHPRPCGLTVEARLYWRPHSWRCHLCHCPVEKQRAVASILKHWKMNWCDLWIDGTLVFYKTDSRRDNESCIRLKSQCVDIKIGAECRGVVPPEGYPKENLLVMVLRDRSTIAMCANSEDESMAWKLTMMETKGNLVFIYNPYDDGYQFVPVDSHTAVHINPGFTNGGTHHILVHQHPSNRIGGQVALGVLAGMATGAAMHSFMWIPFWFC